MVDMDYIHYEKYDNDIIGIFRRINITSLAIGWGPRILTKIVISSKVPTFLYIIAPQKWTIPTVELFFLVPGQSILLGRQNRNRSAQQVACSQSWTWFNLKAAAQAPGRWGRAVMWNMHKYAMAAMDADVPTCRIEFSRVKCVAFWRLGSLTLGPISPGLTPEQ